MVEVLWESNRYFPGITWVSKNVGSVARTLSLHYSYEILLYGTRNETGTLPHPKYIANISFNVHLLGLMPSTDEQIIMFIW